VIAFKLNITPHTRSHLNYSSPCWQENKYYHRQHNVLEKPTPSSLSIDLRAAAASSLVEFCDDVCAIACILFWYACTRGWVTVDWSPGAFNNRTKHTVRPYTKDSIWGHTELQQTFHVDTNR